MKRMCTDDDLCQFWQEDGVVYGHYKQSEIDFQSAIRITETRIACAAGNDHPCCMDFTQVQNVSKQAREYFGGPDAAKNLKALAVITNSPVGKVIGNFYMALNRPQFPFHIFNSKQKAYSWLKDFVNSEE